MIHIRKFQLQLKFPREFPARILSELKGNLTPLVAGIEADYLAKLGLSQAEAKPAKSDRAQGELYVSKSGGFFYIQFPPNAASVVCGSIERKEKESDFPAFFEKVKAIIHQEHPDTENAWESLTREERFDVLALNGVKLTPTQQEFHAAEALADPAFHRTLSKIPAGGSLFVRDLSVPEDRERTEALLSSLAHLELIVKDFVVLCKEKGEQILKVNTREAIIEASQKGIRCFVCGKPISEEAVEEILTFTDLGRKMADANRWMPIHVLGLIHKSGIKESVILEEEEFPTLSILAFGEIFQIYLFDRKVSLSDALVVNAKLHLSQAKTALLVGTGGISPVMSECIVQSNPNCNLHFFESPAALGEALEDILNLRQQEAVRATFAPLKELTSVPVHEWAIRKIFSAAAPPAIPRKQP